MRTAFLAACAAPLLVTCAGPAVTAGVRMKPSEPAPATEVGAPPFEPARAIEAPRDPLEEAFADAREADASGAFGRAVDAYARVASEPSHALARWAALALAERLLVSDAAAALRFADEAAADATWPGATDARWIAAAATLSTGGAARARFAPLLERTPTAQLESRKVTPWVEHLEQSPDAADHVEALRLRRRLAAAAAHRPWGRRHGERGDALHAALPEDVRRQTPSWTGEERLAMGETLVGSRDYDDAIDAFEASRAAFEAEGKVAAACEARLGAARTLDRARRREEAADALDALLAAGCSDPDVVATARFLAGRARARSGQLEAGLGHYEALVETLPGHRLADDAALKLALLRGSLGDEAGRRAALDAIPARFPGGDMVGEARFLSAMAARSAGETDAAVAHLDAALALGPGERGEDERGRAAYWRGRLLEEAGRQADAAHAFAKLTTDHPLGYYGQRALQRLAALDPRRAADLRRWLGEGLTATPSESTLVFASRPELRSPPFERALALLRAGAPELARRELAALRWSAGVEPDADRTPHALIAALLVVAGDLETATRVMRSHFPDHPPVGAARPLWRLAYPRAWEPEIEAAAAEAGVPASLVRAIAREESGFSPEAVSPALAYGLLQIIRPTARPIARELGLPHGPRALKRPEVNLRIGATLLARLVTRYEPNPGVVPAAYNAGAGATDRWLRERGEVRFDEWVEAIPYDETRRYTRRVLQSWGIYALLDEGALPRLPEALPGG